MMFSTGKYSTSFSGQNQTINTGQLKDDHSNGWRVDNYRWTESCAGNMTGISAASKTYIKITTYSEVLRSVTELEVLENHVSVSLYSTQS